MPSSPTFRSVQRVADWFWRKPVWCRVQREHVPDPADLFQQEAHCLRCGRHYDDAAAQAHRSHRVVAQSRGTKRPELAPAGRQRSEFATQGRQLVDHG